MHFKTSHVHNPFILSPSHSPNFASKRCAPASIRLVDNAQFQFGEYVDHCGVSAVSKGFLVASVCFG